METAIFIPHQAAINFQEHEQEVPLDILKLQNRKVNQFLDHISNLHPRGDYDGYDIRKR